MPGLVDTHIHASQFPNNGVAMDLPLLEWLQTYTFPTEANFSDTLFAREVYSKVVVSQIFSTLFTREVCIKVMVCDAYSSVWYLGAKYPFVGSFMDDISTLLQSKSPNNFKHVNKHEIYS